MSLLIRQRADHRLWPRERRNNGRWLHRRTIIGEQTGQRHSSPWPAGWSLQQPVQLEFELESFVFFSVFDYSFAGLKAAALAPYFPRIRSAFRTMGEFALSGIAQHAIQPLLVFHWVGRMV